MGTAGPSFRPSQGKASWGEILSAEKPAGPLEWKAPNFLRKSSGPAPSGASSFACFRFCPREAKFREVPSPRSLESGKGSQHEVFPSFLVLIILSARRSFEASPSQLNLNKGNFISRVRLCGLSVQIPLRTQMSGTHSLPLLPCGSQRPSSFSSLKGEDWGAL